jgi:tetratricopeptide (TPR) repeat protein
MNYHFPVFLAILLCFSLMTGFGCKTTDDRDVSEVNAHRQNEWVDRGVEACKNKNWDEAINFFSKAVESDPKNALAYSYRGAIYFAKGDLDKAIDDLSQSIHLNPRNESAYMNRGSAYRAKEDFSKAITDFNTCLHLNSSNHLAYKNRAACYSSQGSFNKSIKSWNEGLMLEPNDSDALASRGWAFFMTGQFKKAISDYKRAINVNPTNHSAYNNFAWLRATCPAQPMRDGVEAVQLARKACELTDWNRCEPMDTLAASYAESGDFEQAIAYEKKAIILCNIGGEQPAKMERRLLMYEKGQKVEGSTVLEK